MKGPDKMEREELLGRMAPCGLACYTCAAAKDGAIQSHSRTLLRLLESFDGFAERSSDYEPTLKKYPDFKEVLLLFASASCEGCRDGKGTYPGCRVSPCTKEKGLDFCFECEAFPCDDTGFEPQLREKWLRANNRMREIGAEAFFNDVKDKPHYS
jgi:hypothetical protein